MKSTKIIVAVVITALLTSTQLVFGQICTSSGTVSGSCASAIGRNHTASGTDAVALGRISVASGQDAITIGRLDTANTWDAIAIGLGCKSSQSESKSFGSFCKSSGVSSMAMGAYSVASSDISIALGYENIASGNKSHAYGNRVDATNTQSYVIGSGMINSHLTNNIPYSMMMGFNSDTATFFIGPSGGTGTTGNVGIATVSPSAKLHVVGTGKYEGALDMTSNQIDNLADPTAAQDAATKAYVDNAVSAGGGVTGMSANEVPKWNGSAFEPSDIVSVSDMIGIGNTDPQNKLDVTGTARFTNGNDETLMVQVGYNAASDYGFVRSREADGMGGFNTKKLSINEHGGNVGINLTNPTAALHVDGTGKYEGQLDMTSNRIVNVSNPTAAQDAATKDYVDDEILALNAGSFLTQSGLSDGDLPKWDNTLSQLVSSVFNEDVGGNVSAGSNNSIAGMTGGNFAFGSDNNLSSNAGLVFGSTNDVDASGIGILGSDNWVKSTADKTYILGDEDTISGTETVSVGYRNHVFADESFAVGSSDSLDGGSRSFAVGFSNTVLADEAYAVGTGIQVEAEGSASFGHAMFNTGTSSYSMGRFLMTNADSAMMLGVGVMDFMNPFVNNIDHSLMIGFKSNLPTLFVGPSNGVGTTGNVGIGNSTPSRNLDVTGAMHSDSIFADTIYIGPLKHDGTGLTEELRLSVDGAITSKEVLVTSSNWADYVFCEDYELQSLEKVEEHIAAKGHLPNTPSAADVANRGGISLGEVAINQQEKIEELYLHMIEMNKRVKQLEQENMALKQELRK